MHAANPDTLLPTADTIQQHIVDMANETVAGLKTMISVSQVEPLWIVMDSLTSNCQELDSKVSLSLDCWTSSNQYAFLTIIMHYVNNDWELGMCSPPCLFTNWHISTIYRRGPDWFSRACWWAFRCKPGCCSLADNWLLWACWEGISTISHFELLTNKIPHRFLPSLQTMQWTMIPWWWNSRHSFTGLVSHFQPRCLVFSVHHIQFICQRWK